MIGIHALTILSISAKQDEQGNTTALPQYGGNQTLHGEERNGRKQ
jgi:hypothetical protein